MNIGTLTIEMAANIARLQQDMQQAKGTVDGAMRAISGSVDIAKNAFIGLTGVASSAMFVSMVNDVISAEASLKRLSIQTGASVESLSAIGGVAKLTGTDLDTVGAAMNELQKNLAGSNEESKGAAQALKALGISFAEFQQLKADEQILGVAKAMARFEDGGGKSAAAMMLFGKAGAQLLPLLAELAEKNQLLGKVTTENATQALEYEKNMKALEAAGNAWKRELVNGLLPTLVKVSEAMVTARKEAGLFASIQAGLQTLLTGDDQYKNDRDLVQQTERMLALQNGLDKLRANGYDNSTRAVQSTVAQINALQQQINTTLAYRRELEKVEDVKKQAAEGKAAERAKNGQVQIEPGGAEAGQNLLNSLMKQYEGLTGSVNVYIETQRALLAIKQPVSAAMRAEILQIAQLIDHQRNAKLVLESYAVAQQAIEQARDSANAQFTTGLRGMSELSKEYGFQTLLIGKQAEQIERMNFVRKVDLDLMKIESELGVARSENLITEADYTARLVVARQAAAKALADQQSFMNAREARLQDPYAGMRDALLEYEKTVARVANSTKNMMANAFRGMEDALVQFVKTGQLDFGQLADSIISDLIRIQIQQSITGPLAGAMRGLSFFGGSAGGGGAGDTPIGAGDYGPLAGTNAAGGPVTPGLPYLVGEKGPEIIVPQSAGNVLPSGQGMGGTRINYAPVIQIDSRSDRAAVYADVQRALQRNNEQLVGMLKQQGAIA